MSTNENRAGGLENAVVADTEMSLVDGEQGRLFLRGYSVEQIALEADFENVVRLFVSPQTPRQTVMERLGRARELAYETLEQLGGALDAGEAMDGLRAAVAHLRETDPYSVIGAVPVYAAAWWRRHRGQPTVAPDPSLTQAADYLRMLFGDRATREEERALAVYLSTVVDHGMNASTFAARVVASTESDLVSAVVAAIGALKGRLHGGAPGPVLDMIDAIGSSDRAGAFLEAELQAGRRIMGMGHRVYRVRDPRAAVLEQAISMLGRSDEPRLQLARATEAAAERLLAERHPARPLKANVEFYTAVLLEALGLPRSLFTATFAVGRVVGWSAHVLEQRAKGRLIRPKARYVGQIHANL